MSKQTLKIFSMSMQLPLDGFLWGWSNVPVNVCGETVFD